MSTLQPFPRVEPFCGIIFAREKARDLAVEAMVERMSEVDHESKIMPFDYTDYYCSEMGSPLYRCFVAFRELVNPEFLPEFKLMTLALEKDLSLDGCRQVNLDPGYLSTAAVVIATAKNHAHRIPLRNGVYAHLEYVVRGGGVQPLDWTYPDFRTSLYLEYFNDLRLHMRGRLRELSGEGKSD